MLFCYQLCEALEAPEHCFQIMMVLNVQEPFLEDFLILINASPFFPHDRLAFRLMLFLKIIINIPGVIVVFWKTQQ